MVNKCDKLPEYPKHISRHTVMITELSWYFVQRSEPATSYEINFWVASDKKELWLSNNANNVNACFYTIVRPARFVRSGGVVAGSEALH